MAIAFLSPRLTPPHPTTKAERIRSIAAKEASAAASEVALSAEAEARRVREAAAREGETITRRAQLSASSSALAPLEPLATPLKATTNLPALGSAADQGGAGAGGGVGGGAAPSPFSALMGGSAGAIPSFCM